MSLDVIKSSADVANYNVEFTALKNNYTQSQVRSLMGLACSQQIKIVVHLEPML